MSRTATVNTSLRSMPDFVEVAVTFRRHGDGGLHDVVVISPEMDAGEMWRNWHGTERILVVVTDATAPGDRVFETRWFSPSGEIELCGSGAVAAAQVMFERLPQEVDRITMRGAFHDIVAAVTAHAMRIRLPRFQLTEYTLPAAAREAIGIENVEDCMVSDALRTAVARLPARTDLATVVPHHSRLRAVADRNLEALILTTAGARDDSFEYRYFAPWHGMDESPVAVSANALLGPYWRDRLQRHRLRGCQMSRRKPSFNVEVEAAGTWVEAGVEHLQRVRRIGD